MEKLCQINGRTDGRDKMARLIQYASRALWHIMEQNKLNPKSVNKLKTLEYILSNFRKLLRFGRCLDMWYMATYVMHHDDALIKINCTLSRIAQGMYLFCDHLIWLGRAGLANVDVKHWNRVANKYWLLMLIMNLTRDLVEIHRLMKDRDIGVRLTSPKEISNYIVNFSKMYRDVTVDTLKNACDIFIPLSSLGYVNINPSLVGLLGIVSSSAALYTQINPFAKLAFT